MVADYAWTRQNTFGAISNLPGIRIAPDRLIIGTMRLSFRTARNHPLEVDNACMPQKGAEGTQHQRAAVKRQFYSRK
jgi:hypothetical protein